MIHEPIGRKAVSIERRKRRLHVEDAGRVEGASAQQSTLSPEQGSMLSAHEVF